MSFPLSDTMPKLSLNVPTARANSGIELNEELLQHWVKRLPKDNIEAYIQDYLDSLRRFNTNQLKPSQRLSLLDIYRQPLNQLLTTLSPSALRKQLPDPARQQKVIDDLSTLMAELATGYKIIIVDGNNTLSNLKMAVDVQLAINRAGEQISYLILHSYKFYRTPPSRALHELHQLYHLCIASSVEDREPSINQNLRTNQSYKDLYAQLLLTCISNPYGLHEGDVIKAYQMMGQLTAEVDITPLPPHAEATAGHFYINCLSDRVPTPSILPMTENQTRPPALVLNTKPVLALVDSLFQQSKSASSKTIINDLDLLKQLVPFLNTSYQRKQARTPVVGNKQLYLATGLTDVHTCLNETDTLPNSHIACLNKPWQILNKNRNGYLISLSENDDSVNEMLSIGDFVAVFEPNPTGKKPLSRIGFVRWIRINQYKKIKIGLSLIEGVPVAVHISSDQILQAKPALFIPELAPIQQAASLISDKNVLAPKQVINIIPKKKRLQFTMAVTSRLSLGNDYEHFILHELDNNLN